MLLRVACEYQQTKGNHETNAADAHRAERDPSLALGESNATLLVFKLNQISSEVIGGGLRSPPKLKLTDAMVESSNNTIELAESLTDLIA